MRSINYKHSENCRTGGSPTIPNRFGIRLLRIGSFWSFFVFCTPLNSELPVNADPLASARRLAIARKSQAFSIRFCCRMFSNQISIIIRSRELGVSSLEASQKM
jgi:hypothetical protein